MMMEQYNIQLILISEGNITCNVYIVEKNKQRQMSIPLNQTQTCFMYDYEKINKLSAWDFMSLVITFQINEKLFLNSMTEYHLKIANIASVKLLVGISNIWYEHLMRLSQSKQKLSSNEFTLSNTLKTKNRA